MRNNASEGEGVTLPPAIPRPLNPRPRRTAVPSHFPSLLTAMSAVLCVVAIALWVRSYWRTDYVQRRQESPQEFKAGVPLRYSVQVLKSDRGRLLLGAHWSVGNGPNTAPAAADDDGGTLAPPVWTWAHAGKWVDEDDERWWQRLGFFHRSWTFGPGSEGRRSRLVSIGLPLWLPVVLTALPPLLAVLRSRRRRRMEAQGLCIACGYELRSTPTRCPECGTVPRWAARATR
jgi:hypothetical protein